MRHDVELLEGAAHPFDKEAYLAGLQTPVFFGSAINTFGVQQLLDAFVDIAEDFRGIAQKYPDPD